MKKIIPIVIGLVVAINLQASVNTVQNDNPQNKQLQNISSNNLLASNGDDLPKGWGYYLGGKYLYAYLNTSDSYDPNHDVHYSVTMWADSDSNPSAFNEKDDSKYIWRTFHDSNYYPYFAYNVKANFSGEHKAVLAYLHAQYRNKEGKTVYCVSDERILLNDRYRSTINSDLEGTYFDVTCQAQNESNTFPKTFYDSSAKYIGSTTYISLRDQSDANSWTCQNFGAYKFYSDWADSADDHCRSYVYDYDYINYYGDPESIYRAPSYTTPYYNASEFKSTIDIKVIPDPTHADKFKVDFNNRAAAKREYQNVTPVQPPNKRGFAVDIECFSEECVIYKFIMTGSRDAENTEEVLQRLKKGDRVKVKNNLDGETIIVFADKESNTRMHFY